MSKAKVKILSGSCFPKSFNIMVRSCFDRYWVNNDDAHIDA